jgi:hypothetical protein
LADDAVVPEFTPDMLADPAAKKVPTFSLISAENGVELPTLPSGELGSYLSLVTPAGAPALHFALWGVRLGVEPYPLLLTKPSSPCPGWLRWELTHRFTLRGVPLKYRDVNLLVELLAPGPSRPGGLPAYRPHAWRVEHQQTPTGRRCTMARYVAAAVASDLGDYDLIDISAKVLGLHDHELPGDGKPNKAREFRRIGRQFLALLGCWPWTHAESGKLLKGWRTNTTFLEPLRAWWEHAYGEREQELARCQWAFREGHRLHRREDILKLLVDEGTLVVPSQPRLQRRPNQHEIREREERRRTYDALVAEEKKRRMAQERARETRRPLP